MWIITHIPSGQNICGWNAEDIGFYSYREAHKFLLTMNKLLKRGAFLYGPDFTYSIKCKYITVIHKLYSNKKPWNEVYVLKHRYIFKLASSFDVFQASLEPYKSFLKGNKIISILCERTSIRSKIEQLKPINESEFLIHYVN